MGPVSGDGPPQRARTGIVAVSVLVGLLLGSALVGGAWLLAGRDGGPSAEALTLPATLAGYLANADHPLGREEPGQVVTERVERWSARSVERLSAAHEGAAAAVERYADEGYETQFSLMVVRNRAPDPLFVPFVDAADLRLARPPVELVEVGEVSCEVRNDPTIEGSEPSPDSVHVVQCQRSGPQLTVIVRDVVGDLGNDPSAVSQLVDLAWDVLS